MRPAVIQIRPVEKPARKHAVICSTCNVRQFCLPSGLDPDHLRRIDSLISTRRRLKRGEALYQAGTECTALYAIRSGTFKTTLRGANSQVQVCGFFIGGEFLGVECLGSESCNVTAVALEDSEVCVLSHELIAQLTREIPGLQRRLHGMLAREILRNQEMLLLLGSMRAEQRLAAFLIDLSARLVRRGYSSSDFHLRMNREEMGSYLGIKLETVSRVFSQFHDAGLIEVAHKHVRILDVPSLQWMLHGRVVSASDQIAPAATIFPRRP